MIFSEAALAEAAQRGGKYLCKSCRAHALFLFTEVSGPPGDQWAFDYCPACHTNPLRERWHPRQLKLEV